MFKCKKKETKTIIVNFIVKYMYSGALFLTLNILHILHDVKYAKNTRFILKKGKKTNKLKRLQTEVFFLPNMSPHPLPPIGQSNVSFVRI